MKKTLLAATAIAAALPLFVSAGAAHAATTFTPELVYMFDDTGDTSFEPDYIVSFGSKIAIELDNGDMWVSDGTAAGTVEMSSALADAGVSGFDIQRSRWNRSSVDIDGTLFFFGYNGSVWDIYKTDGVTVTRVTTDLDGSDTLYHVGDYLYVWDNGSGLSQVDPSTGTIVSIQQNNDCTYDGNSHVQLVGGLIVYAYDDNNCHETLFTWDPANPSTPPVEITAFSGGLGSFPDDNDYLDSYDDSWVLFNGEMYFTANANDGTEGIGYELFKTDGTQAGTVLVKDINPSGDSYGPNDSFVSPFIFNDELYFGAYNGTDYTLWKTDGTTLGTVEAIPDPIDPGENTETIPLVLNGKLFLDFSTPDEGSEFYVTDGTEAGTTLLKDIRVGGNSGVCWNYCVEPVLFSGQAFFIAFDDTSSTNAIWTTDGTPDGTVQVTTFLDEYAVGDQDSASLVVVGDNLFFGVSDEDSGEMALYKIASPSSGPQLPNTGADLRATALGALAAMALVALGGALVIARRRNAQV